jgi:N-acyl-phosphatidylethanolamine-hydrolysing phospholipase D
MHFGTFDLSDEPLDEPPARFLAHARERGLHGRAFVLAVGETRGFGPAARADQLRPVAT